MRRGEERRDREHYLYLNGNAITPDVIHMVLSTITSYLLAFISNMNYGTALTSKC